MLALLKDYARRSWVTGMVSSVALFGFFIIAARIFLQIQEKGSGMPFTRLMPEWLQSAFNISPANMESLNGFFCVCFQHPFVLIVMLGMPIAMLTAYLTGDVEKRTLALVLARPVSRGTIVLCVALIVIFWVVVALASILAGCHVGAQWTNQMDQLNVDGIRRAALALGCLVFAFTGVVAALSSTMSVRGDAVGWALTVVLVMFVWNFLAQVWAGARHMGNYSLFHYYQPTDIILLGTWDVTNLQVLSAIGVVGWVAAFVVFRLRSFSV